MELINWPLMREPINWVVVILMLAIAVWGMTLLSPSLGQIGSAV
jgi:hypothetical protein